MWVYEDQQWWAGTANGSDGASTSFSTDIGTSVDIPSDQCTPDRVMAMHQSSQDGLEDMSKLSDLHEGALLYNIHLRSVLRGHRPPGNGKREAGKERDGSGKRVAGSGRWEAGSEEGGRRKLVAGSGKWAAGRGQREVGSGKQA